MIGGLIESPREQQPVQLGVRLSKLRETLDGFDVSVECSAAEHQHLQEAAVACGVPVDRTVTLAFMIMGGIVAITGFMQTAYAGASTTTVGELMELDAIAACVIGGASLKGGRGTVLGTLLGALIMASLLNGMTLLAVAPELKLIVRGSVLVLAVLLDVRFKSR